MKDKKMTRGASHLFYQLRVKSVELRVSGRYAPII
jgi:hypothetical protein